MSCASKAEGLWLAGRGWNGTLKEAVFYRLVAESLKAAEVLVRLLKGVRGFRDSGTMEFVNGPT